LAKVWQKEAPIAAKWNPREDATDFSGFCDLSIVGRSSTLERSY